MKLCDDLRQAVLQAAIQGKLTKQYKEDGDAADLLADIQAEKARLVKEKKIKKEKPLPEIMEDEIPFDIPENWVWCHLIDCVVDIADIDHKMPNQQQEGIPYVSPANFIRNGIDFSSAKKISVDDYEFLRRKCTPEKNDIIFPRYGTIGEIRLIQTDMKFLVSYSCATIKPDKIKTSPFFFFYALQTQHIKNEIIKYINKTTQPNVGLKSIKKFLFPLPPLSEQHRIVAKVDVLMAQIDDLEQTETALTALKEQFPKDMKAALLQAAIQGKLTDQRASDGDAADLLATIEQEKQQLIKEKKIKKEKALPAITDDEIPFDIPENWVWIRLAAGVYNHGQKKPDKPFSYIDIGTLDNVHNKLNDEERIIQPDKAPSRARKIIKYGDIIYSTVRPYLHNICTVDKKDFLEEPIASTGFYVISCCLQIYNKYLFYVLLSPFFDEYANRADNAKGVAYPAISDKKMDVALIPIPPLAEQHRIVAKLDRLLPLCDDLATLSSE